MRNMGSGTSLTLHSSIVAKNVASLFRFVDISSCVGPKIQLMCAHAGFRERVTYDKVTQSP